jgi:adenosylmethionine-8-amino-7-oxononanoate aminotransferase
MSTREASPIWHPFTQHALQPAMTKIARAERRMAQNADGSRIFDGISSWWVITHGHNYPPIVRAIQQQVACSIRCFRWLRTSPAERRWHAA